MDRSPSPLRHKSLLSQAWLWLACLLLAAQGGLPAPAPAAAAKQTPSGISAVRFVRENRAILQARFATAAHVTQERASTADRRDGDNSHPPLLPSYAAGLTAPTQSAAPRHAASNTQGDHEAGLRAYHARAPPLRA